MISGSVRAFVNPSRCAHEIHWASMAKVPRVCWNCGNAFYFR